MKGSALESAWMLAASFLFACMGVCVKFAAVRYSAAEIVFYRSVVALAIMVVIVRLRNIPFATPHWRRQLFRGASGFVSLLLYFYAIVMLPLATAVTLNYTSPLFLVVFLVMLSGMRMQKAMLVTLLAGFAGVLWLLKPTLSEDQWLGALVGLGSGILAGLAYFNVRSLGQLGEPESRTVFYFSLLSAIGGGLWMAFFRFHPLDMDGVLLLLGVGGFATAAQLAMTRSYRRGIPLVSASLAYSAVLFASLFGIVFWGETVTGEGVLAMLLIAGSGVMATRLSGRRDPGVAASD
jgi:S-adenosylmethionine uptake transporter